MELPAWRRNQIAITVAACLIFGGFTLVMPFLPYYVEDMGVHGRSRDIWSGILLSIAPLLAATMAPLWGRLADRLGLKIMVQRTIITMVIHWVLMAFASSVYHVLVLRIFLGMFSGFATMSVALVTYGAPRERIGSVIGTLQSSQILAAAAGPFLGGLLYESIGIRATCFVTALFCLGGFALVSFAYDDRGLEESPGDAVPLTSTLPGAHRPEPGKAPADASRSIEGSAPLSSVIPRDPDATTSRRLTLMEIGRLPGFFAIALVLFLATVISRSFGLVAPLYVHQLAYGSSVVGLIAGITVSAGSFAEALSAIIQGRMSARLLPRFLLFAGLALASVTVLPMMLATSPMTFLVLRVVQGFVAGGTLTLGYTIAGAIFPHGSRATCYSLLSSAAMFGGAIGPAAAGVISAGLGIRWVFAAASVLYAALALLTLAALRREISTALPVSLEEEPKAHPYIPVPR